MRRLANYVRATREDQRGLTLLELIIAMSLMMLVLGLCLMIFISSVRTQNDLQNATQSISSAQNMSTQFTKSVRTAQQLRVTSSVRLDLKAADGTCQAWVVDGNSLYTRSASGAAVPAFSSSSSSSWRRALTPIVQVNSGAYFLTRDQVGVQYSLSSGTGMSNIDLVGSSKPRVVSGLSTPCW